MAIALLSGGFNVIIAYQDLADRCRFIPFFAPHKLLGFWIWVLIQGLVPVMPFWLIFNLTAQPNINPQLVVKAALFGLGFPILCNAEIPLGGQKYSLKSGYSFLVKIAFNLILRSNQRERAIQFWDELEASLKKGLENNRLYLRSGLKALENHFMPSTEVFGESADARNKTLKEIYERLDKINQESNLLQKAKAIKRLLQKVEHQDLILILRQFHCDEELLKKYFPRQLAKIDRRKSP
jgi:hypothetical protein